ncbi:MAG: glycosyltransferase family 1 protein [bacterium]|nr:glycosyltransferase family 1 protein [bacterium]
MRILELHAPYFRERWRREHEVLAWGPHAHHDLRQAQAAAPLRDVLAALPAGWTPDLIVLGDDSRPLAVLGLEDAPCPLVFLSVDAHHHGLWQAPLACAADVALVAQRDWLPMFAEAGASGTAWLPLWAPDDLPRAGGTLAHEIAFVGSLDARFHPERVALLDALRTRLPLHVAQGPYAEIFARSRIVLNQTVRGDLNARVFEAMASGALLLTERTGNGLPELFGDGEHLVTYERGDVGGLVALAERFLADEPARARIAARGCEAVRARHLESHRAATVLAMAASAPPRRPAPIRHAGLARAYCALADWCTRYAAKVPQAAALALARALRGAYLAEAETLALRRPMDEPDRSAVLGLVALERGEVARAEAQLGWVVANGGGVADHLAYIDTLVQCGALARAYDAAEALCAAHPGHPAGSGVRDGLRELQAAPPPAADDDRQGGGAAASTS